MPAAELERGTMLVDATYKDLVSDPIAGQAMHPRSAEASGKQTNSGELSFKEITTLLSALVDCDPGAIPKTVHNYFICCERKCSSLTSEQAAVKTDKSKDRFKHYWLTGQYWWACFVEEGEAKGVYCLLCRKHHSKSILNKTCNTFIDLASKRYKLSALSQHSNSGIHTQSIKNEHLQKLSVLHKDYEEKVEKHNTVLEQAFSTCYFLMK